ncbi:MAG: hypothetical protein IPO09_12120 [Anaeromyxobacter sp.]|nr:hypothetical protein [Anaeromyxobacter sp.]MBL0276328.1 hypothetical protein [Anaeromyxobacter sp.]
MRSVSVESKLVLAVATLSLAAGVAGAQLVGHHFERKVEEVGGHVLGAAAEAFALQQRAEVEKLSATLDALQASAELRAAFLAADRPALLRLTAPLLETMRERSRITHWYFYTAEAAPRVFLRVHRPGLHGDAPPRATIRRAIETGEQGAGLELGKTAFALRVVHPWYVDGRLVGYMELAEEVDHFLTAMKGRTGDEYALMVLRKYLDPVAWAAMVGPRVGRWDSSAEALVVNATSGDDGILEWRGDVEALEADGLFLGEVEHRERAFIRGVFPVQDAAGRRVGALFVVHDFTGHHRAMREGRGYALAVLLAMSLLAATGVMVVAHLLVFRRLARLRARLELRATSITPAGQAGPMTGHDDLSRLEVLFDRALGEARGPPSRPPDQPR